MVVVPAEAEIYAGSGCRIESSMMAFVRLIAGSKITDSTGYTGNVLGMASYPKAGHSCDTGKVSAILILPKFLRYSMHTCQY